MENEHDLLSGFRGGQREDAYREEQKNKPRSPHSQKWSRHSFLSFSLPFARPSLCRSPEHTHKTPFSLSTQFQTAFTRIVKFARKSIPNTLDPFPHRSPSLTLSRTHARAASSSSNAGPYMAGYMYVYVRARIHI